MDRQPANHRRLAGVDLMLLLAVAGLCTAGAVSVDAATRNSLLVQHHRNPMAYLQRDLLNDAVGLLVAVPVALLPGRVLRSYVRGFYSLVLLLLIVVLVPGVGAVINGAQAWFSLGVAQLEPSEFAKIAVVGVLAELLARRQDNAQHPAHRDIVVGLLTVAVPLLLILAEPALGIVIIVALSALVALSIAGAPYRWVVGLLVLGVIGGAGAFQAHLLKPYQEQRFTASTDPNRAVAVHHVDTLLAQGRPAGQERLTTTCSTRVPWRAAMLQAFSRCSLRSRKHGYEPSSTVDGATLRSSPRPPRNLRSWPRSLRSAGRGSHDDRTRRSSAKASRGHGAVRSSLGRRR